MKYTFVKVRHIALNDQYHSWMLKCDDLVTLMDHTEKYMTLQISEGMRDYVSSTQAGVHFSSTWAAGLIKGRAERYGTTIVEASTGLEGDILDGKLKALSEEKILLLRESGSYMYLSEGFEVTETQEKENSSYPDYTERDIKVIRYPGGSHYYAKISVVDVYDMEGK